MSGPTDFPQLQTVTNLSTQTITANTETVICTSNPINSRGSNYPINITGSMVSAVQAATTATTMRIRLGTLTGGIVGSTLIVQGGTAGTANTTDGTIGAQYTPALEVAGLLIVLTIQATAAGANWTVGFAQLFITQ